MGNSKDDKNNAPASQEKRIAARRTILKTVALGSGAVAAGQSIPQQWVKPVLQSVILPAHAQSSLPPITGVFGAGSLSASLPTRQFDNYALLDRLLPPAYAQQLNITPVLNNHLVGTVCNTDDGNSSRPLEVYFRVNVDNSVDILVQRSLSDDDSDSPIDSGCPATSMLVDNATIDDFEVQLDDDEFLQFTGVMATAASITGSFTALVRRTDDDGNDDDTFDPCTSTFTALFTNDEFPTGALTCADD